MFLVLKETCNTIKHPVNYVHVHQPKCKHLDQAFQKPVSNEMEQRKNDLKYVHVSRVALTTLVQSENMIETSNYKYENNFRLIISLFRLSTECPTSSALIQLHTER